LESLYKEVDKDLLPKDLGGEGMSYDELSGTNVDLIRRIFITSDCNSLNMNSFLEEEGGKQPQMAHGTRADEIR
jgi:hypothetical protein